MHRIMFVCHGNICRSVMAEMIMKQIVRNNNDEENYKIESSATSTEEIGNGIYRYAYNVLTKNNIKIEDHRARQFTNEEYDEYDYIVCMDEYNIRNLMRIIDNDDYNKVCKLLEFCDSYEDIEDPWYTNNFDKVYNQILSGCEALYKKINNQN